MIYQEKLFSKEECDKIIEYSKIYKNTKNSFKESVTVINNRLISKNRMVAYDVFVIINDENTEWFFDKLISWFSLQSGVTLNINKKPISCTLHCYKTGDSFPMHIDANQEFPNRRYNLGIQLNNNYNGGKYVCWDEKDNEILISKETGTALAYDGYILHEIKKIKNGERWSIVMPIKKENIIEKINLL